MPRATLRGVVWLMAIGLTSSAWGLDPHMDRSLIPDGCAACHRGHGVSGSPMLPGSQSQVCLSCHDSQAGLDRRATRSDLLGNNRSTFLSSALSKPFAHPMSDQAFSRLDPGVVTCTSCHSPHRGLPARADGGRFPGVRRVSPRNPNRFEYELCEGCHGGAGITTQSPLDISRLFSQNSRSYHPVEGPARDASASIVPSLAGREINCTDCHGNDDPSGPRGPHGSRLRFILRAEYTTMDGAAESLQAYALCYQCHDRQKVLASASFPLHGLHVVGEGASCATCHSPHGSLKNRALIRFGEGRMLGGVSPSMQAGKLAFFSDGPGSGSCYLTCHASDHAPKIYGGFAPGFSDSAPGPGGGK